MTTSLRCSGTARATTVRIRGDGGLNGGGVTGPRLRGLAPGVLREGASGGYEDTVVLTIEP